ncbi:MAG: S8 family serine peptidase [Oligoflexia bacterium]|nr:S8 family serine peptidase [Oligoflexia bacterium]
MKHNILIFISIILASQVSFAKRVKFHHGKRVVAGEYIIKLKNPLISSQKVSAKTTNAFISKARGRHRLNAVSSYSGLNLHHMKLDEAAIDEKPIEDQIAEIKENNPEVDYVEPNYLVEKASATVQTQAYTLSQVLNFIGSGYGMTSAAIQAQNTWPLVSGAQTVTVAVIDTGLDLTHPSFNYSIHTNLSEIASNGIDDDGNGFVDDVHGWNFVYNNNNPQDDEGHGTHVSGIVVGVGDSIFQAPSSATRIQIMPLKFLDSEGIGATSDAIKAIYYAVNNGAKVINNSWGGGNYSQALVEAIAYSYTHDVSFVVASGNMAKNNDSSPTYPASYNVPNVISVAATDDLDNMAYFSNYGKSTVGLSSPGVNILSTWPNGYYAYLSGTSMAAPFVSGVAALMKLKSPQMNSYQMKNILLSSVDQKSNLNNYVQSSGRVNVLSSVNNAINAIVDGFKPAYTVQVSMNDRELASSLAGRGGCGSIEKINQQENGFKKAIITLALLLIPVFLVRAFRNTNNQKANRRRHDRYAINSQMTLKLGGQELIGSVKTISVGGTEINTQALLTNGSVIKMTISSPDGKESIQVEGSIVWSESEKRYGVAFNNISDSVRARITQWQKALIKV